MKKFKSLLSSLCLVAALTFTVAPAKVVNANTSGGPQGGSNSTTSSPQPQMSYEEMMWILVMWLLGWL